MNRPIFIIAIAFINGILIGIYSSKSIFLIFFLIEFLTIILLFFLLEIKKKDAKGKEYYNKRKKIIKIFLIYTATLIISTTFSHYKNDEYCNKYKNKNDKELKIVGTIISEVKDKDYKYVCTVKVEKINNSNRYKNDYLLLNIKKEKDAKNKIKLNYADKIAIVGNYEEPEIARNYKGFNYKNYLKTQGIYGTIKVEDSYNVKVLKKNNLKIYNLFVESLANSIKNNLHKILQLKQANLAVGILIGHAEDIDSDIVQNFKNSNLSHMLAVSGMHVGYLVLTIKKLLNKNIIGIKTQKIAIIIFLIIFVKLAKNTPSVCRASFTYVLYVIASLLHRKPDVKNIMSIDILITTILQPFSIFNVGMQLSYAGTIGILMFYNLLLNKFTTKNKITNYIISNIILSCSANIYIIPIMMYQFNTISLTFILSNIVASPLLGIAMTIGIVAVLISFISINLAKILGVLLNMLLKLLINTVFALSKIPGAKIYVISPNIIIIVSIIIIFMLVLYKNRILEWKYLKNKVRLYKKVEKFISILILSIMISHIIDTYKPNGKLTINFIDVGQGDSTLIKTPSNKKILIDGGGNMFPEIFDVGEKTLLPYLLHRRIQKLDYILISHFDSDHVRRIIYTAKRTKD